MSPSEIPGWGWALIGIGIFAVVLLFSSWLASPKHYSLRDKVVVITGGSSGIGKAIAAELLKRGANVALVARRQVVLDEAAAELKPFGRENKLRSARRITTHAADVTDETAIKAAMASAAAQHGGRIDCVIASAGISQPRRFEETSKEEFLDVYRLNVLGARNSVLACLPFMAGRNPQVSTKEGGRVMLISSQAGQAGLYGYTAYSSSKFALQGFCQALSQELYTRNILVSQCFPPDTDTPLLASENLQKPVVTRLLSESSATVPASVVAESAANGLEHWRPSVPVGFDGWMLSTLTSGMGPCGTLFDAFVQVLTLGLWRFIALFYVQWWYRGVVAKHDHVRPDGTSTGGDVVPAASSSSTAASATGTTKNVPAASASAAAAAAGATGKAKRSPSSSSSSASSPLSQPLVDEDAKRK